MSARDVTPWGQFQLRRSHLITGPNPHTPGSHERRAFAELSDLTGAATPPPASVVRAARIAVCDRATDVEDARMLLDALGLVEAK